MSPYLVLATACTDLDFVSCTIKTKVVYILILIVKVYYLVRDRNCAAIIRPKSEYTL